MRQRIHTQKYEYSCRLNRVSQFVKLQTKMSDNQVIGSSSIKGC